MRRSTTSSLARFASGLLALAALLAPVSAFAAPPLYVPWPCGDRYRVTQGHNGGSHTGESAWAWDFGIPVGGEVAAPADGVISHIRMDSREYGCSSAYATKANYVVIDLGNGTQAQLAHLQAGSSNLRVGDRVRQGDIVGKVGLSGYVCGAHLHFKIQKPCRYFTCESVPAEFVEFGDPRAGTTIESNNCQAPDETELLVDSFDRTDSDVDGDGAADVCARTESGIECSLSASGPMTVDLRGPELSDDKGWADISNYSTIRLADVTGDGRADLCARANAGIRCWPSEGNGFGAAIVGPELADDANWNSARYYSTLRMPDVDGDDRADICARAGAGVVCHRSTGDGFEPPVQTGIMSDAAGWDRAEYYATLRVADLDGDGRDDACARDANGLVCWLSDVAPFATEVRGPAWSDASGWDDPSNYLTIRLGDIDGDGRADVCARSNTRLVCHLFDGIGFGEALEGPAWADAEGWSEPSQYASIALADVDGDGRADACGRGLDGVECWFGATSGQVVLGPQWTNDAGWQASDTSYTVRFADVNADGRADVCGRTPGGYECWPSTGDGFESPVAAGLWPDATARAVFSTIRVGGGHALPVETPVPEAAPETPPGDVSAAPEAAPDGSSSPTSVADDGPLVIDAGGAACTVSARATPGSSAPILVFALLLGGLRRRRR